MAMLTISGSVHRPEGIQDAFVVVELLCPCFGGHRVAAVSLMQPDGTFGFPPVDAEQFDSVEAEPAIFVRAMVATVQGPRGFPGRGKCVAECCECVGAVEVDIALPPGLDLVEQGRETVTLGPNSLQVSNYERVNTTHRTSVSMQDDSSATVGSACYVNPYSLKAFQPK